MGIIALLRLLFVVLEIGRSVQRELTGNKQNAKLINISWRFVGKICKKSFAFHTLTGNNL